MRYPVGLAFAITAAVWAYSDYNNGAQSTASTGCPRALGVASTGAAMVGRLPQGMRC